MGNKHHLSTAPQVAQIEKFSHDGRGIARINGKTTFIGGALPGETVSFQYTKVKKDFDEGQLLSVISRSAARAEPRCPHYQLCGGCSLQHLNEEMQIQEKQLLLLDLLQRIAHIKPELILPPLSSVSWNYRNKARLSVRYVEKKKAALVGFREKNNPRFIAEISQCPILNPKVDGNISKLRELIDSLENPHSIAQIEVAAGDEEVALILRNLESLTSNDEQVLRQFSQDNGFTLYLQPGNAQTVTRFHPPADSDFLTYSLPKENIHFKFHPTDFTQVNASLNQLMITHAMQLMDLKPDDIVLDLFCGLGNFSLPLAKRCKRVIGIEGSGAMVLRAQLNAQINNIANAEFYCADLDKPDGLKQFPIGEVNKILIDPPRSGALELVKQFAKLKITRLVYVSCNPATLARDSDILVNQLGFKLKAAGVMDMFPHTAHVESIALFEKG
ncbi:23S rRNA (uracil-5-)-methyltransferase RumA [Legionella beliardensis]|uniref:23S rRNA (uracil(1939)-C(5))-methyltransferase RlmD n=1 Tax=Legionella beliardensis TaxID=91822 RepID=A0A378I0W0_9GAMM|nr:23S rRNA (uracil(1939)-C(5))-methyltransferase RlmD [Legionella beliardensis]STX28789.1 23S rRNA (uracil-5-)-methyltransferase RumA [Legionella beliardensis]